MRHTALWMTVALIGCNSNIWEIAVTGHVFEEAADGTLAAATSDQVELCWDITTQVEVATAQRAEALTGCEAHATSRDGVINTVLYGMGGRFVEDLYIDLSRGDETVVGSIVSRHVFDVSCESTYTYEDADGYEYISSDPCQQDLYESIGYHFVFRAAE